MSIVTQVYNKSSHRYTQLISDQNCLLTYNGLPVTTYSIQREGRKHGDDACFQRPCPKQQRPSKPEENLFSTDRPTDSIDDRQTFTAAPRPLSLELLYYITSRLLAGTGRPIATAALRAQERGRQVLLPADTLPPFL